MILYLLFSNIFLLCIAIAYVYLLIFCMIFFLYQKDIYELGITLLNNYYKDEMIKIEIYIYIYIYMRK